MKRISFSPAENFALAPSDTFFITHVFQWDDSESRATCLYEGVRAFVFGSERERGIVGCVRARVFVRCGSDIYESNESTV